MDPAFLVRFRPRGPWRIGPDTGARDRVDRILHSDTLFSALTQAMHQLDEGEAWLEATAKNPNGPEVRLSSCFPALDELLFVPPPRSFWPPPPSLKVRWKGARFVPLSVAAGLLGAKFPSESRWSVDGASQCLIPLNRKRGAAGPFRAALRGHAAVDRNTGNVAPHRTACLEFAEGGGLWAMAAFDGERAAERWAEKLKGAFRLLADTGLGGERSLGWGRSETPEFRDCRMPELFHAQDGAEESGETSGPEEEAPKSSPETAYWLLSMFTPGAEDQVDWRRGSYSLASRGGRVESPARWGEAKKQLRMVEEGSVILATAAPRGTAPDVAPDGFPHPVYRAGFALAVPFTYRAPERAAVAP